MLSTYISNVLKFIKRKFSVSLVVYLLFIFILLLSIKSSFLTADGAFTFSLIHKSFKNIIKLTSLDVHPFLYYFVAKIFISPFHNEFIQIIILRLLSATPYIILFIISNVTLKYRFGKNVSLLFIFLLITMPYINGYIYIARMYSLAMLLITSSFLLFVYVYKGYISNSLHIFILISFCALAASYSHYYSLIIMFMMYVVFLFLFMLSGIRIRYILISIVLDIFGYFPWLLILFKQTRKVSNNFWSPQITIRSSISNLLDVFCPKPGYMIFYLFPVIIILLLIYLFFKYKEYKCSIVDSGFIIALGTLLIGIIVSIIVHHRVIEARYLVPVLGIVWFSVSLFIGNKHMSKLCKILLISILVITGLVSYSINTFDFYKDSVQLNRTDKILGDVPDNDTIIYNCTFPNPMPTYHLNKNVYLEHKKEDLHAKVFNMKYNPSVNISRGKYFFIKPVIDNNKLDKKIMRESKMFKKTYVYVSKNNKMKKYLIYKIQN